MEQVRHILFYRHYFDDFFNKQTEEVKNKIDEVLFLVKIVDRVSKKFLQHIENTNGLYELRVEFGSNIFRIFCCFDKAHLVVLFNGFQKKTQKTPKSEIEKAIRLLEEYFLQKKG